MKLSASPPLTDDEFFDALLRMRPDLKVLHEAKGAKYDEICDALAERYGISTNPSNRSDAEQKELDKIAKAVIKDFSKAAFDTWDLRDPWNKINLQEDPRNKVGLRRLLAEHFQLRLEVRNLLRRLPPLIFVDGELVEQMN